MNTTTKPTLRDVRAAYNARTGKQLTSLHIAECAGIPLSDEWTVEVGGLTSEGIVSKVIEAFVMLTGEHVGIGDISVRIRVTRPNLATLCNRHGITALTLAQASNRPVLDVWDMATGVVDKQIASSILASFNTLARTSYSLDDLHITFEAVP